MYKLLHIVIINPINFVTIYNKCFIKTFKKKQIENNNFSCHFYRYN